MEYEQILADTRDGVLVLTLNRPERLNAWTPKMMAELTAEITAANDDPSIGVIVVTGAGRGFCAGADIGGQFAANLDQRDDTPKPAPQSERRGTDWVGLCRASKPIVAAINVSDSETVLKDVTSVRDEVLRAAGEVSAQLGWRG